MKGRAVVIASFWITLISCSNEESCTEMKAGTFSYGASINSSTKIIRNSSTQVEINEKENFVDQYSIVWESPCKYYLVLDSTNKPSIDYTLTKRDTMKVQITDIKENRMLFYAQLGRKTFSGEMNKISIDSSLANYLLK